MQGINSVVRFNIITLLITDALKFAEFPEFTLDALKFAEFTLADASTVEYCTFSALTFGLNIIALCGYQAPPRS